jgi:hypothetical protein
VGSRRVIFVAAPPRAAHKVGKTGFCGGPAEKEKAFPPMGGSDIAGSYATPDRVIPRLGQVPKYTVETTVA